MSGMASRLHEGFVHCNDALEGRHSFFSRAIGVDSLLKVLCPTFRTSRQHEATICFVEIVVKPVCSKVTPRGPTRCQSVTSLGESVLPGNKVTLHLCVMTKSTKIQTMGKISGQRIMNMELRVHCSRSQHRQLLATDAGIAMLRAIWKQSVNHRFALNLENKHTVRFHLCKFAKTFLPCNHQMCVTVFHCRIHLYILGISFCLCVENNL